MRLLGGWSSGGVFFDELFGRTVVGTVIFVVVLYLLTALAMFDVAPGLIDLIGAVASLGLLGGLILALVSDESGSAKVTFALASLIAVVPVFFVVDLTPEQSRRDEEAVFARHVISLMKEAPPSCRQAGLPEMVDVSGQVMMLVQENGELSSISGKNLPTRIRAIDADEPVTVFLLFDSRLTFEGRYEVSEASAFSWNARGCIVRWPELQALAARQFHYDPPEERLASQRETARPQVSRYVRQWVREATRS